MTLAAVAGATLICSFGMAPSRLVVAPGHRFRIEGQMAATVMDGVPLLNIQPFGMCRSLANPTVAAATSAAMGVLTPQPCVPATQPPWQPGAKKARVAVAAVLDANCKCRCMWGGVVRISMPQAVRTHVA
ncbi:hypothetical protein FHW69_001551 [Luteibacter sp. Sphag1AF]|uniref:DUF4280 domain-containing protein n=1 Tax=Luteibacter sp. Sphag1AF TaxID=2587031 RepID=UPI0016220B84|nr:DUF4280 domain-containing protein [Luteibacter sp. Sphag1AF]MBB3226950.1 hypothetical protein [Luteibacter sp. Sphag1AF]